MISEKLVNALSDQINKEMTSSYLYLGMAAYFEDQDLPGFANWMRKQAQEELEHGLKIYDYLFSADVMPKFASLEAPTTSYNKPEEVIQKVLEHEKFISQSVYDIYHMADEEKDYRTTSFLQWFIDEQINEEADVRNILGKLKHCDTGACLMMIDNELGNRE